MKAWRVYDREFYTPYAIIVFAETRGKAVSAALCSEEFPKDDWNYTELCALRAPTLDKHYRGKWRMEWDDDEDRLAMIREAGFFCQELDSDECERCSGKEFCEAYKDYLDDNPTGRW